MALKYVDLDHRFETKMRQTTELLRFYQVPKALHRRITDFYNFKFSSNTLFDENALAEEIPTNLRNALVLHRFAATIDMVPFLQGVR